MPALEFPRRYLASLHEVGARLLDKRKAGTAHEPFARELLASFFELCVLSGLDRVLTELDPTIDLADATTLSDHPTLHRALVAQLATKDLDGGGPRNARPGQLADALVAALGLTVVDEPDRTIALDDQIRGEVKAAVATAVDPELALPKLRETIVMNGRAGCPPEHLAVFEKIVPHLDERGMRMLKQPKVPLEASHAVQRVLVDVRNALFERVGRAAIDRAQAVIARVNAEAAARIDQPITLRMTPRQVAILRVSDARVPKVPASVVASIVDSLAELAHIVWRAPEHVARAYAPSETFAVGDVLEHPKFGRGTVTATKGQRMDVEFADTKLTLVHARPK